MQQCNTFDLFHVSRFYTGPNSARQKFGLTSMKAAFTSKFSISVFIFLCFQIFSDCQAIYLKILSYSKIFNTCWEI